MQIAEMVEHDRLAIGGHTSTSERSSSANAIVPPKAKANDQHLMMAFVAWRLSQPLVVVHFPAVATIAAAPYARPTRAAGSGGLSFWSDRHSFWLEK